MEKHNREALPVDDVKSIRSPGGKWRAWSWRSNVNRDSLEEEPHQSFSDGGGNSPARRPLPCSIQSSPTYSPASSPGGKLPLAPGSDTDSGSRNSSPRKHFPSTSNLMPGQRMSTGARLSKVFEENFQAPQQVQTDEHNSEKLWSFFVASGRPASVSVLQTAGTNFQL